MKALYLDFEFNQVTEENVNLVCCSTVDEYGRTADFWVHNDKEAKVDLAEYLKQYDTFICYSAVAECRSFYSLGLNPLDYQWIDLFLEYRCISNHNDEIQWGKQLVDGKVKVVHKPKPKWERTEEDSEGGFMATHSLAEATYKILGEIRDTAHKNAMRDLIISDPRDFSVDEASAIMKYCAEDTLHLKKLRFGIYGAFENLGVTPNEEYEKEAMLRGRYAAHTAIMESKGYPIDVEKTKNFSRQVSNILYDCQREINSFFPEIKPFKWVKAHGRFRWDQKATREWIKANVADFARWTKTDTGEISLSLEAWQKFFNFTHEYPSDNFGAQIVRFLKLKQSLYGFVPAADSKKKTFWDSVGSDGRVRPYYNIYGSQSSRSQPSSTGFMFLKPAWMRALVIPKPGYAMCGVDYKSQEFYIQALMAEDQNMIDSYLSEDVYFAFAKLSGMVPKDAKIKDYKVERNLAKSLVLGLSYLMSKYGLAGHLTNVPGMKKVWTEDEAQEMIDIFYETYSDLKNFQDGIVNQYKAERHLKLPCGWYIFGDNENHRSVTNVPSQGFGASVMRKAVDLAVAKGLYVPITLHDALYIEYKVGNEHEIKILQDCMVEAFAFYVDDPKMKKLAYQIKLDSFAWSRNYPKDSELPCGTPCSNLYIDERALEDYNTFSKYFEPRAEDEL